MRALRKPAPGPGLELQDVPEPSTGFGEVKIRVMRTGLCGTDLHLAGWDEFAAAQLNPPQTLGHEFYGKIVELGPGVDSLDTATSGSLAVGQRVSVEGHVTCGRCRNCRAGRRQMCQAVSSIGVNRDGAFADYVVVPADNVWLQGDEIDPDLGALFDPFGNAVHTTLQFPIAGEDVLVTGAGPIGIMCAALASHAGARNVVLTDLSEYRLALARSLNTPRLTCVNTGQQSLEEIKTSLGIREGFDVGLEISGAPAALRSMISNCTHGAKIAMLGLPKAGFEIDWNQVITHMLTIKGVYGREMYDTWYKASFMLESSPALRDAIRGVITHRYPAEQWEEAFAAARAGECGKVVLDWTL